MVGRDCKHMTRDNKLTIKDLLIVGAEFVCAMGCAAAVIVFAGLIVTLVQ